MDRILVNRPDYGDKIARRAGSSYNPAVDINFARVRDGVLLGGAVFTGYTGESIFVHTASWTPHWINRDLLFMSFDYPFNQLRVKRMFGLVPADNTHAQDINLHFGFKVVARIEGVYRNGIACVVMCMEHADCRFLNIKPRGVVSNRIAS